MLSRKAVCLWLLAGAVCVALAAGAAGLAQQPNSSNAPAADPSVAAQPGGPVIAQGDGGVAAIGGSPTPAKGQPVPAQYYGYGPGVGERYGGAGAGMGGYSVRGGGVQFGAQNREVNDRYSYYPYTNARATNPDPEMEELLKKDAEMEGQVQHLVGQWHEQKDDKVRADLRSQVEKLTKEHFDLRQQRRELELSRLEAQLERVRASVKKRNEVKDLIIQRRIARLLGEEDDLAF